MKEQLAIGPWPDVATARFFLRGMVYGDGVETAVARLRPFLPPAEVAEWLVAAEIGGLARARYGPVWPELRRALQDDHFLAVGEWELHAQTLARLEETLQEAGVTAVLLKGAALALTVYPEPAWRTMSDIDLWVRDEAMGDAVRAVQGVGFAVYSKEERPWQLQRLSRGEVQLYRADWAQGLVELHWSAFQGWWMLRVANADAAAVWARKKSLSLPESDAAFYQLEAADTVLQVGLHLAIGHQFGMKALQGLIDIALTARARRVDWRLVAERARRWRVATAVYTVLHLLDQLIGAQGVEIALQELQPGRLRRRLIGRFVSPESLLAGRDVRGGRARYLLLLLLVDRPRDMLYLVFRTLWPEEAWLAARYGERPVSRWRHVWNVLRYGRI